MLENRYSHSAGRYGSQQPFYGIWCCFKCRHLLTQEFHFYEWFRKISQSTKNLWQCFLISFKIGCNLNTHQHDIAWVMYRECVCQRERERHTEALCAFELADSSWQLCMNEWCPYDVLSSAALARLLVPMDSSVESLHLIFGLLFLLLSVFPSIIAFFKEPCLHMMCQKLGHSSVVIFASSHVPGLICSRPHLCVFLVVQGTKEISSNTLFQINFFLVSLLHCPAFTFVHSNWDYKSVNDLNLGL